AAPVGTAVFDDIDTVLVAHDYDLSVANPGTLEVANFRYFTFQPDEAPGIAGKERVQLFAIDLFIGIDPCGNSGDALFGPASLMGSAGDSHVPPLRRERPKN